MTCACPTSLCLPSRACCPAPCLCVCLCQAIAATDPFCSMEMRPQMGGLTCPVSSPWNKRIWWRRSFSRQEACAAQTDAEQKAREGRHKEVGQGSHFMAEGTTARPICAIDTRVPCPTFAFDVQPPVVQLWAKVLLHKASPSPIPPAFLLLIYPAPCKRLL